MVNLITVIGTRPQVIKASAISRTIKNDFSARINERIIDTGQHYDDNLSSDLYRQLNVPKPKWQLITGSGTHATQTSAMLIGIEKVLVNNKADAVLAYGDTNSTLAASLAASKLKIPLIHIEAGMRSFNKNMPEEINRIVCDRLSTLLFSPTEAGITNLMKEGFKKNKRPFTGDNPGIFLSGDVMYDNSIYYTNNKATDKKKYAYDSKQNNFIMLTIHRDSNTDNFVRLKSILETLNHISRETKIPIVFPMHPRTSKMLKTSSFRETSKSIKANSLFHLIPPVSYLEMQSLLSRCLITATDSGGVQKESFFHHKPCIVLRNETEWVELITCGNSILADAEPKRINEAFRIFSGKNKIKYPPLFGNGKASYFICNEIVNNF